MNLFVFIKLVPRLFNEFKMLKGNTEKSYSEQLFFNDDITKLQQQINAGEFIVTLPYLQLCINQWCCDTLSPPQKNYSLLPME